MSDAEYFVWTDVETTGLDANRNWLLEIAAIVTTVDTLEQVGEPFHHIVQFDKDHVENIKRATDDFVVEMHKKTGLWDRITSPTPIPWHSGEAWRADEPMLEWLKDLVPNNRQGRIAGNSVRLDLNFVEKNLPETYAHLHYRFFDVTGFCYGLETQGLYVPGETSPRDDEHTAMGDILASIAQYKDALEQVQGRISRPSISARYKR